MTRITRVIRNSTFGASLALALVFGASMMPRSSEAPGTAANVQISNEQFARYIDEWSEPEGYFDSDNFISNETSYLHVVGQLRQGVQPGGVYIGVGPDQNFSYIVHTRPALAVIPDIRRQNMLQHLLFKALFVMAANRAEYLALLFSKATPNVKPDVSFEGLLEAVRSSPSSEQLFKKNLAAVKDFLTSVYRLKLSPDDVSKIGYVYTTFFQENLRLRFSSIGRGNAMQYPTFEAILLETDREGRHENYLSSEELFQWLKKFQMENRLIPIVGDFAGPHAFKTVARYLKDNGLRVSTFYTSNVEFYLFGEPAWPRYLANVHALPVSDDAVFIRAYFPAYGRAHPLNMPGHRPTSLVKPLVPFLTDYDNGRISTYWDVVRP